MGLLKQNNVFLPHAGCEHLRNEEIEVEAKILLIQQGQRTEHGERVKWAG